MPSKIKKHLDQCIDQLESGQLRVRVRLKLPDKTIRQKTQVLPEGTTLKQAQNTRETMRQELSVELADSPQRITLGDYALDWLQRRKTRLKPGTFRMYAETTTGKILPELGDIYLDALSRRDIEAWVVWVEAQRLPSGETYAHATVKAWWRVLALIVRDACADHGHPDPTTRVRPPATHEHGRKEKDTLTRDELVQLLGAVEAYYPHRLPEVYTLAVTGMRISELHALKWEDIDEPKRAITVRRALSDGQPGDTKTHSDRRIAMTDELAELLRAHRMAMIESQHPGLDAGLVFPSDVGTYRARGGLRKALDACARHLGLTQRVTPQVFRRTLNTLLVQQGVSEIVVRAQMGHVTPGMTQHYAGVQLRAKHDALSTVFKSQGTP